MLRGRDYQGNPLGTGQNKPESGLDSDRQVIKRAKTFLPGTRQPLPRAGRVPMVGIVLHWGRNSQGPVTGGCSRLHEKGWEKDVGEW